MCKSFRLRLSDQMTAADVVNTLDEVALARIISRYGEEKHARSIATAIVESRYAFGDITTTGQLIKIINSVFSEGWVLALFLKLLMK